MKRSRSLELLSPAQNLETAIQAIIHGADAVYMGATSHGARKNAGNSLEDIEKVVDFAHQYRAKVYITVNTLIYENELRKVEQLCKDLYHIGVDALIIQDMGILRMSIPPIALHASTQCDIRTPEKARFLEEVGFSQLVLARELTLSEIKNIAEEVTIPIESFIHGALCVCYSGRCQASYAISGRSGNRGECSQICRLPFTLSDSYGNIIVKDKHLLSLKDFNASSSLENLIDAGVSSFKIEGRLKDISYVKNITSFYNNQLNAIIEKKGKDYMRTSYGVVSYKFTPNPDKSFNRGFTDYFLNSKVPISITSLDTPKSLGEKITDIRKLNNGDGISFFNNKGEFTGVNVNKIENDKIIPSRPIKIPLNAQIYRTSDIQWEKLMNSLTAERKIPVNINLDDTGISIKDARGLFVKKTIKLPVEISDKKIDYSVIFEKLGTTCYKLNSFNSEISQNLFFRFSELTKIRREIVELLNSCNIATYPYEYRRQENLKAIYPEKKLDYRDNVSNSLAFSFYRAHGVDEIQKAAEVSDKPYKEGSVLMTTRHCVLRELGLCKKVAGNKIKGDLFLTNGNRKLKLTFDCKRCEMNVCR